jgi:hypothetical protein
MAIIPAYCKSCGSIFASRAFRITGNVSLHLAGNRETCIVCGQMADIVDGTFHATDGFLKMIGGPTLTRDILEQFSSLVERAATKEISLDALEKEVGELDPTLGEAISQILKKSPFAIVTLLIVVLTLKACHFNVEAKVDINQLWDQWIGHGKGIVYTTSQDQAKDSKSEKGGGHTDTTSHSAEKKGGPSSH